MPFEHPKRKFHPDNARRIESGVAFSGIENQK
jgi:hypothetical protein